MLEDERSAFRDELQELNSEEAFSRSTVFIPVGWESTHLGVGRPQSRINADLRECDYFVLVLHDRWGSPPGKDGGTE
jgi:hypothetical protein